MCTHIKRRDCTYLYMLVGVAFWIWVLIDHNQYLTLSSGFAMILLFITISIVIWVFILYSVWLPRNWRKT